MLIKTCREGNEMTIIGTSILQRDPGATVVVAPYGPRGPVIQGTSVTPVLIANGPVTFTLVEYGLGFQPGIRLRATAIEGSNQWVEGVVTEYDEPELTINVDLHSGTDVYYSWQITVAGQPGLPGPQGPKGDTGQVPEAPSNGIKYARMDAQWANITVDFAAKAPLFNPVFTGTPQLADVVPVATNNQVIATTAFVKSNIAAITGSFQPLDADLTQLAAASGAGVTGLHYRKAADTWVPLTMGSGITIDTGANTLNVVAGGGNVSTSGTITTNDVAVWASSNTIKSVPIATWRTTATFAGTTTFSGPVAHNAAPVTAPTVAATVNDTQVATTAYVRSVVRSAYGVRGLVVDTSAPVANVSFWEAILHDANGVGVLIKNGGFTITVAAAVGANGPDAAIASTGDVSFYAIWGSAPGVAGICSNNYPNVGPVLPSGYTHWGYLTTIKRNGGNLQATWTRGNKVFFIAQINIGSGISVSSWTPYSAAGYIPSSALAIFLNVRGNASCNSGCALNWYLGAANGLALYISPVNMSFAGQTVDYGMDCIIPNISQTVWLTYVIAYNGAGFNSNGINLNLVGYEVYNGS